MDLEKLLVIPLQNLKSEEIEIIQGELGILIDPDPNWYNVTINGIGSGYIASHESIMDCIMKMGEDLENVISIIKRIDAIREKVEKLDKN